MRNLKAPDKKLFEYLFKRFKVTTDVELARELYTSSATLSRIRNNHKYLNARMILIIYDKTDLTIEQIRKMVVEEVGHGQVLSRHRTGNN